MSNTDRPYTKAEVCDLLGISPRTLARRLTSHRMGQFKLGLQVRFARPVIDKHVSEGIDFPLRAYPAAKAQR